MTRCAARHGGICACIGAEDCVHAEAHAALAAFEDALDEQRTEDAASAEAQEFADRFRDEPA